MTTHEIISASENPCGGVSLTIRWSAATTTTQYYGSEAAKALGWKRPDPQPVAPAWMVEVAREACALQCEAEAGPKNSLNPGSYRSGRWDDGFTVVAGVGALRLALSRGHVVLAPVMPSEEEMLRDAREEVAQAHEKIGHVNVPVFCRAGQRDTSIEVQCALQARRNVYASLGAKTQEKPGTITSDLGGKLFEILPMGEDRPSNDARQRIRPEVDLRSAAESAWAKGFIYCVKHGSQRPDHEDDMARDRDVSAILENLNSGEA